MKLTVQVQLLPDTLQRLALRATLDLANRAANLVSDVAWRRGAFRCYDLQQITYGQVRALGLSAQPTVRVIKKVADAYNLNDHARRTFRPDAAQPYDDRCLSWQLEQRTVSIWTVVGRLKGVRFTIGERQKALLAHRKGESDLLCRDGKWYLHATCEVPEAERTGRGIALEDLRGIRGRVRLRKPQRATLHTWAFHQLGRFIAYKARRAGVVVVWVDPAYTSQACSECGHVDKDNRPDQATFQCRSCGFAGHADWNAARNIAERGVAGWAAVSQPNADWQNAA